MGPALIAGGAFLGSKLLSSLFGNKSKKKQQADANRATVAGLDLKQKQGEDQRIARLQLAHSILGKVPGFGLDPALVQQLMQERKYDFGSAMPTPGVGAGSGMLSDLFGGAAQLVPWGYAEGAFGGSPMSPGQPVGQAPGTTPQTVTLASLLEDILNKRKGSRPYGDSEWHE